MTIIKKSILRISQENLRKIMILTARNPFVKNALKIQRDLEKKALSAAALSTILMNSFIATAYSAGESRNTGPLGLPDLSAPHTKPQEEQPRQLNPLQQNLVFNDFVPKDEQPRKKSRHDTFYLPADIWAHNIFLFLDQISRSHLIQTSQETYNAITSAPKTAVLDLEMMQKNNVFDELKNPKSRASMRLAKKTKLILKYGKITKEQLTTLFEAMPLLSELTFDEKTFSQETDLDFKRKILDVLNEHPVKNLKKIYLYLPTPSLIHQKDTITKLAKALINMTGLKTLYLDLSGYDESNNFDKSAIQSLSEALMAMTKLEDIHLDLTSCDLNKGKMKILNNALKGMKQLKKLNLIFEDNDLDADDIDDFSKSLVTLTNLETLHLNFTECKLDKRTIQPFCEALGKMTGLTTLDLVLASSDLDKETFDLLLKALANQNKLRTLRLTVAGNPLGSISEFFTKALKSITNLTTLDLNFATTNLDENAIKNLLKSLSTLTTLKTLRLDVSDNPFTKGIEDLNEVSKGIKGLTTLDLDLGQNHLDADAIKGLSNFLISQIGLRTLNLNLSTCQIDMDSMRFLIKAFVSMTQLQTLNLDLGENGFHELALKVLLKTLTGIKSLTTLDLTLLSMNINDGTKVIFNSLFQKKQKEGLNWRIYL